MDVDLIRQVFAALERERLQYVVFGAVALALHGLPRATEYTFVRIKSTRPRPAHGVEHDTHHWQLG